MRRRILGAVATLPLWLVSAGLQDARGQQPNAQVTTWEALMPKDWDPMKDLRKLNPSSVREGSAQELDVMREVRKIWDNAPTRKDLDGASIRLPGYVVPLDTAAGGRISEFLLVPYFGACIHSPPPPANQIVHVKLKLPAEWRTMQAVWVSGRLSLDRQDSAMGVSGYAVVAEQVETYQAPAR
jgi:hypothetical protein